MPHNSAKKVGRGGFKDFLILPFYHGRFLNDIWEIKKIVMELAFIIQDNGLYVFRSEVELGKEEQALSAQGLDLSCLLFYALHLGRCLACSGHAKKCL